VADNPKNLKIHSTYRNNLVNLSPEQIAEIEALKDADENLWNVFGLGLRGTSTETIYTHYRVVDQFPQCERVCYGLDFGFVHPTALVKVGELDGKRYAEELLFETGLTNGDLAYLIKTMAGLNRKTTIWCDGARPEAIEELKKAGLKAEAADKAVWEGIRNVQSMPLCITRNSTNLLKEIKTYKWQVDARTGQQLEVPVKFKDDGMDALRYGVHSGLSKPIFKARSLHGNTR
jgi:phage terminase large subunit